MTKPKPSREDIRALVEYVAEINDRLRGDGVNSLAIAVGSMRGADNIVPYDDLSEADADLLLKLLIDIKNQNPEVWGVES
jgi:hypothetical protein